MKDFIFNEFVQKYGRPSTDSSLIQYIEYNLNYSDLDDSIYSERHHILPATPFPQYIDEPWNIVKLNYRHHVESHVLLFNAYPQHFELYRTLNWMLNNEEKIKVGYKEALSAYMSRISKDYWNHIKTEDTEKYDKWCSDLSNRMKQWQASYMANIYYEKYNGRQKQSEHFKSLWADPEYKERTRHSMIAERNSPEGQERLRRVNQKRWDEITAEEYNAFQEKMSLINKDPNKRKIASESLKRKWTEPDYLEKMKNRKPRGSDGSTLEERWKDKEFRENQRICRLASRIKRCIMLTNAEKQYCDSLTPEEIIEKYGNKYKKKHEMISELKLKSIKVHPQLTIDKVYEIYKKEIEGG